MIRGFWRSSVSGFYAFLLILGSLYEARCDNKSSRHCAVYVSHYEKQYGIPRGLLQAISKVESGLKNKKGERVAWPWTLNAKGKSYYFPTKKAAMRAAHKLKSQGITSMDVGCMQINLYHHPSAFKNLKEAFDPEKNIKYAALFLAKLKNTHASWKNAISRYHSANLIHSAPYQKNVLAVWHQDRKRNGQLGGEASKKALSLASSSSYPGSMGVLKSRNKQISSKKVSSSFHPGIRRTARFSRSFKKGGYRSFLQKASLKKH